MGTSLIDLCEGVCVCVVLIMLREVGMHLCLCLSVHIRPLPEPGLPSAALPGRGAHTRAAMQDGCFAMFFHRSGVFH